MRIVLPLVLLMLISLMTIFSIGKVNVFYKQLIFWIFSWLIFFSSYLISYKAFVHRPYFDFLLGLTFVLLLLLFVLPAHNRSWFQIGDFSFQPSEFGRISLLLILMLFLSKYADKLKHNFYLIVSFAVVAPLILLIVLEPDFGMAFLYFLTWLFAVIGYISRRQVIAWGIIFLLILVVGWFFILKDYQKQRILTFFFPERDVFGQGYNLRQIKVTVGSAGLWGKGFGGGTQAKLGFLPSSETDFILASFIEEWGFVGFLGLLAIVVIFLQMIYRSSLLAIDPLSQVFSYLLFLHLSLRYLLTTAVNLAMFPIIGLPVPFLSAGGSHLITDFILLSIWRSLSS
jgi:rod shape determining protein RodA